MATTPQAEGEDGKFLPHFANSRRQHIFSNYWLPNKTELETGGTPKALVFIAHGAGEHCLWYGTMADALTQHGILVFSHDHVGHGQSEGDRLHINTADHYVDDVMQHVDLMQKKYPKLPVFLLGHSMGGAIAILTAMRHPDLFAGVVLDAPLIKTGMITPCMIRATKMLACLAPQLQLPGSAFKPEDTCRDEAMVKRYKEDPLNWHGGMKARFMVSMVQAMDDIQAQCSQIQWPFLLLHGDEDKLCDIEGSRFMMDHAQSGDKSFNVYKTFYHQLHNEPAEDGARVRQDIVNWICQRI